MVGFWMRIRSDKQCLFLPNPSRLKESKDSHKEYRDLEVEDDDTEDIFESDGFVDTCVTAAGFA